MRPVWLILMIAPVSGALLEDAAGDADGPFADGAMDLRALEWTESELGFDITLHVGALDAVQDWRVDAGRWYIQLLQGDHDQRIQIGRSLDGYWWAMLEEANPNEADGYAWVESLPLTVGETTLQTFLARDLLRDEAGAPASAGTTLEGMYVHSMSHVGEMQDRMPNEGTATYAVQIGPKHTGGLRLSSPEPWRASNGEATTYVYTIQVRHALGGTVALSAIDVPERWSVLLPMPRVDVAAGELREVPVVVQTPFAHRHDTRERLAIHGDDGAGGTSHVELGIEYLSVPQPSGHHDTLYFHSRSQNNPLQPVNEIIAPGGYNSYLVLNGQQEDDADTREPKEARPLTGSGPGERAYWYANLSPRLLVGLDMDLDRLGAVEIPVRAPTPVEGAVLSGTVYHCLPIASGYDCNSIAQWRSQPTDINPAATLVANVEPLAAGDLVPWAPEAFLAVNVIVTTERVQTGTGLDALEMMPGGRLQLPLLDYADSIDDLFGDTVLGLNAAVTELTAPAGAASRFEVVLDNRGTAPVDVELRLDGVHVDWAELEGASTLRLKALERRIITVAVTPPLDAVGERADLLLQATGAQGASVLRLVAHAAPGSGIAEAQAEEAPGFAPLGLLFALGVAWRRR